MKLLTVSALLCAVMALNTAATCPKDWSLVNGKCYIYESKSLTYIDAEKNCQSKGGNLAPVHSDDESKLVGMIVINGFGPKSPSIWLGDSESMKNALRKANKTPANFRNFCRGQPNRLPGNQDCLNMQWGVRCLQFSSCGAALPSVCIKRN